MFADPARLLDSVAQPVDGDLNIDQHAHRDWLQFDLAIKCTGHWLVDGQPVAPRGPTAAIFYPLQRHGYRLVGHEAGSTIYSFKLRVTRSWPVVRDHIFPAISYDIACAQPITILMDRLAKVTPQTHHSPLIMATLVEAICMWPGTAIAASPINVPDQLIEQGMQKALSLMAQRIVDPPSLEEIAAVAMLSPRHFARRFKSIYQCTPHAWLEAHRLDQAKRLLIEARLSITEITQTLGFPTIHSFSRWFRKHAGIAPSVFRQEAIRL
jgi:AraC-like DNA-binding protein